MINKLVRELKEWQDRQGTWKGYLSSSALATAVSVFALHRLDSLKYARTVYQGLHWLADHANPDGGWGDTTKSQSNLSTTLLCWSALAVADHEDARLRAADVTANAWLEKRIGNLTPKNIAAAILKHYGNDHTFSVPILTMVTLSGRLGEQQEAWCFVPQLPFELAVLPGWLFRWIRMPVVSYALPALIAMGLVRHRSRRSRFFLAGWLRDRLTSRALLKLNSIQPVTGGFLEAQPLSAFVLAALCGAGKADHPVVSRAADFLTNTVRKDGSWPIDTKLNTWLTTQAVQAIAQLPPKEAAEILDAGKSVYIRDWLLQIQYKSVHPYTGAAPGGWAWTDLPGGVPDADDTAGALTALRILTEDSDPEKDKVYNAARYGVRWLLDIQNRDGGIPTFCRGWGILPFDQSCPDITAHFLRAVLDWRDKLSPRLYRRAGKSIGKAIIYLLFSQNKDGSWTPLWFGNEAADNAENRTYGTAKVVIALQQLQSTEFSGQIEESLKRAEQWLLANRNIDGGWGAAKKISSTIEETALAIHALSGTKDISHQLLEQGLQWLTDKIGGSEPLPATPIGLYFASLWYWERLYPTIFSLSAFAAAGNQRRHLDDRPAF